MKDQPPKLPLCHDVVWQDGSNYFSFAIMLVVIIEGGGLEGVGGHQLKRQTFSAGGEGKMAPFSN